MRRALVNLLSKILFLLAFIQPFSASASNDEGGHTGNGGGVVFCKNAKPLVLDYFEALQSGHALLDLENISREKFFSIVISRLRIAVQYEAGGLIPRPTRHIKRNSPQADHIEKAIKLHGSVDRWPEIPAWRVHDELIENSL